VLVNLNFKPAWWLPGGHLQTIGPSLIKRKFNIKFQRERLYLPDGDFVDLDWTFGDETGPIIIMLHGLEGSIKSSYSKGMLNALKNNGFRAVFMHFRGCSGEHNHSQKAYHAGETHDFNYVVQTIRQRFPSIPLAAIGYSLGGNVLLKYLGETQMNNPLTSAVAISVPFKLNRLADRIQKGFSAVYQRHLLSQIRKKMLDKNKYIPFSLNLSKLHKIKTFWQFDGEFTAKIYNFKDAHIYYEKSSSAYYLSQIKKPTLIIHALNDPFLYVDAIPNPSDLPDNVRLELFESGGHMGFIGGGLPWRPKFWLEERVPDYFKKILA